MLGPAFVAAVAYVDPGNFATNFAAGAQFGYLLLWVIVVANVMAMLIQSLSAKLGVATGKNLPELCREHLPRAANLGVWAQAELVAIATDLAEVVGGAIALNLLFGIPLFTGGVITGVIAFGLLALQSRGHRPFERAIVLLLAVILVGLISTLFRVDVDPAAALAGLDPAVRRRGEPAAGHRHPRRDRDAARDLPALRADPAPAARRVARRPRRSCSAPAGSTSCSGWGSPGWSTCPCC